MSARKKPEQPHLTQSQRFIEVARDLGCDEDADAFKDKLKKLASAPPPKSVEKRKTKKIGKS